MTQDQLAAIAGALLSFGFSYIPGLSDWFDTLDGIYKRIVMGALVIAAGVGAYGLACAGIGVGVDCTRDGALALVSAVVAALIANQAMYGAVGSNRAPTYVLEACE